MSRSAEKIERGDSLVSPGLVCYAEKQVKPFWFSSLDQIVHFGAIIFCRTFVELFWSVRVDRKKRVTIIVAFHFMKRRLKIRTLQWTGEYEFLSAENMEGTRNYRVKVPYSYLHIKKVKTFRISRNRKSKKPF